MQEVALYFFKFNVVLKLLLNLLVVRSLLFRVIMQRIEVVPVDRDSSVGIATGYGLDGPGTESPVGASFSASVQTGLGASRTIGTGFISGG
jgi:hypothetical protein